MCPGIQWLVEVCIVRPEDDISHDIAALWASIDNGAAELIPTHAVVQSQEQTVSYVGRIDARIVNLRQRLAPARLILAISLAD